MDNLVACWEIVAWTWLKEGHFDRLKCITLDFSKKLGDERPSRPWVKNKEMEEKVYNFLTSVDMARRHGIEVRGERIKRCVGLRWFTVRGIFFGIESEELFRFWFGENVNFMTDDSSLNLYPSVTCTMQP